MRPRAVSIGVVFLALVASLLSGCGKKDDTISQAEKKDKDKPSIAETKAIAEEGFIYGLPTHRDELWGHVRVRGGPQLRAVQGTVQSDQERTQRIHLQGHGHRYAEQRHTLFLPLDGFARGADGAVGSGGGQETLLLGDAL